MQTDSSNNKLIAKNATMLYIRMFINMSIQLFTSRIVLQALGVSDFGIYNLVGGIIVLVNMLSRSLSSATSRFITYALGENDSLKLSKTFSTALWVHIGLSFLFLILAESIGLWFINTQLVIPQDRMVAANWVYQVAILSTFLGITQAPYNATINSHENFTVFAYISIVGSLLKLLIAYITLWNESFDNLKIYSFLYALVSISIMLFYRYYCVSHYKETRFKRSFVDKKLLPHFLSYSGWNLLGSSTMNLSQQGLTVLINWFFGTVIIAAAGVAGQVQATLNLFASNITAAFSPQIIKEYAQDNFHRVNELISMGAKLASMMTLVISVPVFIKLNFLMGIWLVKVPEGAVIICQILLIKAFFNNFNPLIYNAMTASGDIKWVNILCSIVYVLTLPIAYAVLYFTHSYVAEYTVTIFVGPYSTCCIYMYLLKKKMPDFFVKSYVIKTIIPMTVIGFCSLVSSMFVDSLISNNLISLITVIVLSSAITILGSLYIVFDKHTRKTAFNIVKSRIPHIQHI